MATDPSLTFQNTGLRPFLSDYGNYGSFGDWWNSLSSAQQIQAGMLGASTSAKRHFGYGRNEDTGYRPSGYTPVNQTPAIQRPAELGDLWGAGITQLPAGTPNLLNPNGPTYPTIQPELNPLTPTPTPSAPTQPSPQPGGVRNTFNDYFEGDEYGVYGPPPSVPPISIFEPQPSSPYPTTLPGQNRAPTGMFAPNPYLPGGWEATMFQDYANMPHIANPAAPEVALEGSYLNAGDTMRIPTNLMPNVPSEFGGLNQQTQWNGYWSPNMTGMVGPHGIAAGYGFYNSNSPVNYTGLFAQSNPFWGNPTTSPTMPTPSPSTLSPYYGVGPESHFGRYFQTMRQNAQTLGQQRAEEEQQRVSSQQQAIADMTGCPVDDLQCQARFWIDQGG